MKRACPMRPCGRDTHQAETRANKSQDNVECESLQEK